MYTDQREAQIVAEVPEEEREKVLNEFREKFRSIMDRLVQQKLELYEELIPLVVALGIFASLVTLNNLLAWVPALILDLLFRFMIMVGLVKVILET